MHHVFARGNRKQRIFLDDWDRRTYLGLLGKAVVARRWGCLAYCLMHNHVHLLLETAEPNLGKGMRRFHGVYAQGFNERHGYSGHVFQGRYGSVRVKDDAQLLTAARYIALNPVEAGFCRDARSWPWGSHAAVVGSATPPAWLDVGRLLGYLGAAGGDPRQRYAELVR